MSVDDEVGQLPALSRTNRVSVEGGGEKGRGRQRRITKEHMLRQDHVDKGLDENGCRIRIFTAKLTGARAVKVKPGERPNLAASTYTGETIPSDRDPAAWLHTLPGKLRHGHGEIVYSSGSKYVGQWANDVREGKGLYTFECGDVYDGGWSNGMYNGHGSYVGNASDSYDGQWKDDKMHGHGRYTYHESGDVYEGGWVDGMRHGVGKEICGNGDVYEGEFSNDERVSLKLSTAHMLAGTDENGQRIRIFTAKMTGARAAKVTPGAIPGLAASTYTGETTPSDREPTEWLHTLPGKLRHGHGEIVYASGSKYVGQWAKDVREGKGLYTFACGDVYDGGWSNGMYNGHGSYVGNASDSYDGQWKDDKMHGHGRYTYHESGDVYEGGWVDGLYHGQGTYTTANGDVKTGQYEAGRLVEQ